MIYNDYWYQKRLKSSLYSTSPRRNEIHRDHRRSLSTSPTSSPALQASIFDIDHCAPFLVIMASAFQFASGTLRARARPALLRDVPETGRTLCYTRPLAHLLSHTAATGSTTTHIITIK